MRIKELDFLKWIAIVFMVIDHLRFLDVTQMAEFGLFSVGRIAFPFFCFLLAYYFFRTDGNTYQNDSDKRYIRNLAIFTLISEIPYRLYGGLDFNQINIMFTLLLSFVLVYSYSRPLRSPIMEPSFTTFSVVLIVLILELTSFFKVQYGLGGVLLPLAMYLLLTHKNASSCIFVVLCAVIMNFNFYEGIILNSLPNFVMNMIPVALSVIGALLPFAIMRTKISFKIAPVKKWAYWFYPVHLLALFAVRYIYRLFS